MGFFRSLFLRSDTPLAPHLKVGRLGEEIATRYLRSIGYKICGRNVRLGSDEIDIIAFDPADRVLVFVEVKTRSRLTEDFLPSANAGVKKWKRLRRGASRWLTAHDFEAPSRIDLVSVAEGRVIDHAKEIGGWY